MSVKSETSTWVPKHAILHEENVYLVPEHYDPLSTSCLYAKAEELGATISTNKDDATIIIVNENSPLWDDHARESLLSGMEPGSDPLILPYHWLSVCLQRQARVTVEDLPVAIPYMVSQLTDRYPLKVWVSKNVQRDVDEGPEDAYANVVTQIESVGAIAVLKRAHADVLIVDMASNFFATVKKEKEENQRGWQKLAQRDWVDFCINSGTLELSTRRDEEGTTVGSESGGTVEVEVNHNGIEVDSMMDEDSPVRTGPGRPTGKPRVEYTPEDDDFLCRYLAYHNPSGAWHSRKTYQALVSDQLGYPLAARHTSQSWHERFKKNQAVFGRRVTRFISEKVDRSLKTASERAVAATKKAQREASDNDEAVPAAHTLIPPESIQPAIPVLETVSSVQPPSDPPKRALVTAESRSPTPEARVTGSDPKGKRREVEPVAGPSRSVAETVVEISQEQVEIAVTSLPRDSDRIDDHPNVPASVLAQDDGQIARDDTTIPAKAGTAISENIPPTTQAVPKKKRKRQNEDSDRPTLNLSGQSESRRAVTPVNNNSERPQPGSTPLRQEIERNEQRRREQHRRIHGHGPSARRLSKRAASPDKVYAYVNLPPPRPIIVQVQEQEATPEPPRRGTPPRALTPAEREQSVQAGSRIVQDIAAQYRLKVAALGKRFGVGIKEISAATTEVKRRNGGKNAVDWTVLETVLQEQYGR